MTAYSSPNFNASKNRKNWIMKQFGIPAYVVGGPYASGAYVPQ